MSFARVRECAPAVVLGCVIALAGCDARSTEELAKALPRASVASAAKIGRRAEAIFDTLKAAGRGETTDAADVLDVVLESRIKRHEMNSDDSLALAELSRKIREVNGDPKLHHSLYLCGTAYYFKGDPKRACETMKQATEAIEPFKAAIDPNDAAKTYMGYGILLGSLGESPEARQQYEIAVALLGSTKDPDAQTEAKVLHNYGDLLTDLGEYDAAAEQLKKALAIRSQLDPNGVEVAQTLNAMGGYAQMVGDLDTAANYYGRALDVYQKLGDGFAAYVADVKSNIGMVAFRRGDLDSADRSFTEALRYFSGDENAVLEGAHVLSNQGELALVRDASPARLNTAHALFAKAFKARCQELGAEDSESTDAATLEARCEELTTEPDPTNATEFGRWRDRLRQLAVHPDIAESLAQLGRVDIALGRADVGRERLTRALEIWRAEFGAGHPLCGAAMRDLARSEAALGDRETAFSMARAAADIIREHVRQTVSRLPGRGALRYAQSLPVPKDLVVNLAEDEPARWREAYDTVIRSRAVVLDEEAARWEAAVVSGDPSVTQARSEFEARSRRCGYLSVQKPEALGAEDYAQARAEACADADLKEEALARATGRVLLLQDRRRERQFGIDRIANEAETLPAGSALVSYVIYEGVEGEPWLGAFLLDPPSGRVQFVRLERVAVVDELVDAWRRQLDKNALNLDAYRKAAGELRSAIWDEVDRRLNRASTVLIVPDGKVNLVSFATLPSGDNGYLVTSKRFHYLSAERDLVMRARSAPNGVLVASGPAFDAAPAPPDSAPAGVVLDSGTLDFARSMNDTIRCEELEPSRHNPIQNAGARADQLMEIAGSCRKASMRLLDRRLSKPAFESLAGSFQFVYLLTHAEVDDPPVSSGDVVADTDDPLLRSRLLFTGADCRKWSDANYSDSGMTTAKDLAGLNLSQVGSIILHACKTGTGPDVRRGEGVLGLRRAVHTAGAGSVVMSLWEVDDLRTQGWMTGLFRRRLGSNPQSLVEAVSGATLDQFKKLGADAHPYWWGGFVSAGDWR